MSTQNNFELMLTQRKFLGYQQVLMFLLVTLMFISILSAMNLSEEVWTSIRRVALALTLIAWAWVSSRVIKLNKQLEGDESTK